VDDLWTAVSSWLTGPRAASILSGLLVLVVGLALGRLLGAALGRVWARRGNRQGALMLRRFTFYLVAGMAVVGALHEWGVELGVLLGAAGVLTVAIGFASQTSASNLISGLFLLGERHFVVGDVITADGTTGEVLSIDLLSVKLRTFDNLYVRIPNESLLKTQIVNLSHFPIRRVDIAFGVAYDTDLKRMRQVLVDMADLHPLVLDEPRPLIQYTGFDESAVNVQLSVWVARVNVIEVRSRMTEQILGAFREAGIEIPFPQRVVHAATPTVAVPAAGAPAPPSPPTEPDPHSS
jgi:small-conductance mechanosensitive channel